MSRRKIARRSRRQSAVKHVPIAIGALAANFMLSDLALAGCTNTGGNVVCSGTTSGTYAASAATLTADVSGTWTASGALTGVFYSQQNTNRYVTVNHSGSMTWTDADYGGTGTGARAAFNLNYTYTSVGREIIYTSTDDSIITISARPSLGANRGLYAVAAYTTQAPGTIYFDNKGLITLSSNLTNKSAAGVQAMGTHSWSGCQGYQQRNHPH